MYEKIIFTLVSILAFRFALERVEANSDCNPPFTADVEEPELAFPLDFKPFGRKSKRDGGRLDPEVGYAPIVTATPGFFDTLERIKIIYLLQSSYLNFQ